MEIINDSKEKLELEYPCGWCYKVIAHEQEAIEDAIKEIIKGKEHKLTHSKSSKGNKYVSMNLDIVVYSEDERNFIYESLKAHRHIKMVL